MKKLLYVFFLALVLVGPQADVYARQTSLQFNQNELQQPVTTQGDNQSTSATVSPQNDGYQALNPEPIGQFELKVSGAKPTELRTVTTQSKASVGLTIILLTPITIILAITILTKKYLRRSKLNLPSL